MSGQATTGWRVVQDVIQAAICASVRLPPAQVPWAYQNRNQPPMPYISLWIPELGQRGIDWVRTTYDPTRAAGQEFAAQVMGTREITLELEVFTDTADGLNVFDERAAVFLAEQVKTQMRLPTIKGKMQQLAGVSFFDRGRVQNVPTIVAAGFRGRATLMMRGYVPAQALLDFYGYIATVNTTMTVSGSVPNPFVEEFSFLLP